MVNFQPASGRVTAINDFYMGPNDSMAGCYLMFTVQNRNGAVVNLVIEPGTYFVDQVSVKVGDQVTGFYDADLPVPLIYPPQYQAIVVAKNQSDQFVDVDYYDDQLVNSKGTLKLNLSRQTKIVLENGQSFTRYPANRELVVVYSATTRSIPAQTTPSQVIVLC
ncbi:hypothetical protein [Sporosarcina sp. Te-1]|uniref:hypothetical protein n=1 Tax=Sporosarcina sp. Te-1 TaxID=2818390 RepID=UPI001A9D2EFA|nr:hypothetical protein [Sporosarcina sp. Te-1]QTD42975.1 hypothetical protein J3U78_09650 [Sporosarcina sp. Te-1]